MSFRKRIGLLTTRPLEVVNSAPENSSDQDMVVQQVGHHTESQYEVTLVLLQFETCASTSANISTSIGLVVGRTSLLFSDEQYFEVFL